MAVSDLPGEWNRRMERLLGLVPPTDRQGCLQDIHWAEGLFGYFPSYALGHLISAQLAEAMAAAIGPIEASIAAGEEAALRGWLAETVWPLGLRSSTVSIVSIRDSQSRRSRRSSSALVAARSKRCCA